jgi:membrane protease YdiL (CAAX protease family)
VAATSGRTELIALLRHTHQWRVALRWYLAAIGLPAGIALAVAALDWLLGGRRPFEFVDLPLLAILVIPFYLGEEIGWRGFALPELLRGRSPLVASIILGLVWSSWHLPFFATRLEAFPLYLVIVSAWTVLFTWLWLGAAGSLVVVTLMHAMFNDASVLKVGVEPAWNDLLTALVSIAVAGLVALGWRRQTA